MPEKANSRGSGADFAFVDGTDHKQAEALPAVADGDSPEDSVAAARSIPRLEVVTVVPGGPADRAQVKPGDIVNSVDGHWVVNADSCRSSETPNGRSCRKRRLLTS